MIEVTLDFETRYGPDLTLKKMSYTEYVRHPRFKVFGVGLKINSGPTEWITGLEEMRRRLNEIDWDNALVIGHNMLFDGFILYETFNIQPKMYADTLSMGRALWFYERNDLGNLAMRLNLGGKTHAEALDNLYGVDDPTPKQLETLGVYCINDVEVTRACYLFMIKIFPIAELRLIDLTLSMFCKPVLHLNMEVAQKELARAIKEQKDAIAAIALPKKVLSSNDQFCEELTKRGIEVPMKPSPSVVGKMIPALAKTDEGFQDLLLDPLSRDLMLARLAAKSNILPTRIGRMIEDGRPPHLLPVALKYYGARTGRWSGTNKVNFQNLPKFGEIRKCVIAPPGHTLIVVDSSQIECRMNAWVAEEDNFLEVFLAKECPYCAFASKIYKRPVIKGVHKTERFFGKTAVLGLGYGMGAERFFRETSRQIKQMDDLVLEKEFTPGDSWNTVQLYRTTYERIKAFWDLNDRIIMNILPERIDTHPMFIVVEEGQKEYIHKDGLLHYEPERVHLPNGLALQYPDINSQGVFKRGQIYGAKLTENIIQALARIAVGEQMLMIADNYKVVMTTHDEVVICVPDNQVETATEYALECMRTPLAWCPDLPFDAEAEVARYYSK